MRGSRLASRLLRLSAQAGAGEGTAAKASSLIPRASVSTAAASGSAAAQGRAGGRRWVMALAAAAAAAGAGAALGGQGSRDDSSAQCEAAGAEGEGLARRKLRVVVLGTGWGAISFLKQLDPKMYGPDGPYELVVVSPRSYFLYTPLLPAVAAGSVQERSIVEPVRNLLQGQGTYYQAECNGIDAERRVLKCAYDTCELCKSDVEKKSHGQDCFEVPYDVLIVGVGSVNNTFGIKGVRDHCFFLKSADDAHKLRVHISKVVEHAGLPTLTPEERKKHLNFVVVGGGPTGVELAAELHDLVTEDVERLMPHLKGDISITVVDTMDHLLGALDRQLSEYTREHFAREGIKLQLGTMVRSVADGVLTVKRGDQEDFMPFGTCVWATGVAMHPLVKDLREQFPVEEQNSRAGVLVDSHLRVRGSNGTIYAVGDCAVTSHDKALGRARELFAEADKDGDERLSEEEVRSMLKKVERRYPQMGELAALLGEGFLERAARGMWGGSSAKLDRYSRHVERLQHGLTFDEFQELLADMDTLLRPLAPTAQVASQEGIYLANLLSKTKLTPVSLAAAASDSTPAAVPAEAAAPAAAAPAPAASKRSKLWGWGSKPAAPSSSDQLPNPPPAAAAGEQRRVAHIDVAVPLPEDAPAFKYRHMGTFSYIGVDQAVLDLPDTFPFKALRGWFVGLTWRGFETYRQVSARNRWMVYNDQLRTKLFGRNMTEV